MGVIDIPHVPSSAKVTNQFKQLSCYVTSYVVKIPHPVLDISNTKQVLEIREFYVDQLPLDDIYDMESCKYRGHALVINNHQFETNALSYRDGWKLDSDNLRDLFEFLKFEQNELFNLNAQRMKEAIADFARDEKSVNASSLVVVILTHGDAESFFGVDGCRVDCKTDVVEIFNPNAAPDLQGKPKLFLFQACREKPEDSTREASAPQNKSKDEQWDTGPSNVPRYNMLIVNATLAGSKAYRKNNVGSLIINGFCRIVRKKAYEEHVLDMITKLHHELNTPVEHPDTVHRLSRKWYLFPLQMFCKRLQDELRTHYNDKLKFVYTMPWLPTE
uniref:Caspase family p20 domain-containing protein n=2 Tax=Capitella teleta TaxID=283909 RepID=X1ZI39_CAPTE